MRKIVEKKDVFQKRTAVMTVFFILAFLAISYRMFEMQVLGGKQARKQAESQHSIYKKLLPSRGEIRLIDKFSAQSFILATNIKKPLAYAVPKDIINPKLTATALASLLTLDEGEVLGKISNLQKKYVVLKKQLTKEEEGKLSELKLSGIFLATEELRAYPEKSFLSQTLGFVGFKGENKQGLYGLERFFEKELAGKEGELTQEKDVTGAWIFGSKRDLKPAEDGVNLILTIDKNIQFEAEEVLKKTVEKHGADSGSVVVVDPKTGSIMALAGFPAFDPNEYSKVLTPSIYVNQAVYSSYEPGSIFKPLTMAAAINEGKVSADSTFTDTGSVVVNKFTIKNSDLKAHGVQTMTQVLDESLNTGAIFAKEQIGNVKFLEYLKKFGFGQTTGVELLESKGDIKSLNANILVNYHTASFGQGILVTPMQMVQAYTALANQGKIMKPYIVQSKIYSDGRVENTQPQILTEVVSPQTANVISAMLVSVVENGHGKKAAVSGYNIGGKTGTAQVAKKNGKGYEEDNNIGSFIGYGPVEDPQFLMLVRIDHPRSVKYAESTAAPAFGEIAQFILNYLHIPPSKK